MSDLHKGIITKNYIKLAEIITANGTLNNLVSDGILTALEKAEVIREEDNSKRAGVFLRFILKKDDQMFGSLISAYKKYNMSTLAELMELAGRYVAWTRSVVDLFFHSRVCQKASYIPLIQLIRFKLCYESCGIVSISIKLAVTVF